MRGATADSANTLPSLLFLSTLPVRGATSLLLLDLGQVVISIHAPREGSDPLPCTDGGLPVPFLSTLPVRGATPAGFDVWPEELISIHAPREGSDWAICRSNSPECLISIHAPREGSDARPAAASTSLMEFLSTLPVRGATRDVNQMCGDGLFLSTLPVRGATGIAIGAAEHRVISIHAPREGSDGRWGCRRRCR